MRWPPRYPPGIDPIGSRNGGCGNWRGNEASRRRGGGRALVLVVGLDGGGTSAIAGLLHHLGVDMNPSRDTDRDYAKFEDPGVLRHLGSVQEFNTYARRRLALAKGGVAGVKRPRACLLGEQPDAHLLECDIVNVVRPVEDCFRTNARYNGHDFAAVRYTARLWWARERLLSARAPVLSVEFLEAVREPSLAVSRLVSALELDVTDEQATMAEGFVHDFKRANSATSR